MRKVLAALLCFSTVFTLFADEAKKVDELEAELNKREFEKFSGEWFCYVMKNGVKNLLADYSFLLHNDGLWETRRFDEGKTVKSGRISILGGNLTFLVADGKETRSLAVTSKEKDKFTLDAGVQKDLTLQFERIPEKDLLPPKKLFGEWRFFQKTKADEKEKESPFVISFRLDGSCVVTDVKTQKSMEQFSGTFEIKNGRVNLINKAEERDGYWYKISFFLDGDKLVLNQLGIYVYGLQQ